MSSYIINPSVFYWINVFSIIQTVFAIIGGIALFIGVVLGCILIYEKHDICEEPEKPSPNDTSYAMRSYEKAMKSYKSQLDNITWTQKCMLIALISGSVLVLASIFIPSKNTSIEMLIAKTATFDNVNWSVQQVKEIVDYIAQALKGAV